MSSPFAEMHDELRDSARGLLAASGPGGRTRWDQVVDAGWPGLEVPEELDGAGATFAELAVVLEEVGRAAAALPLLGTAVLGVGLLQALVPSAGRDDLLRSVATGETVVAVAVADGAADAVPVEPAFVLEQGRSGLILSGTAGFVPDAAEADRLLVVARAPDGTWDVVHLDVRRQDAVVLAEQPLLDATRRAASVTADRLPVLQDDVWHFVDAPSDPVCALLDRAAVAVAWDSLGLSEAMLEATVSYVRVREQFGRPIATFQAVKHKCADMLVSLALARELVERATVLLVERSPEAGRAASMAKSYACAAAVDVVGTAVQLHGGIGYTWESGLHVHLKRAALNRALFGSVGAHRRRLAAHYA